MIELGNRINHLFKGDNHARDTILGFSRGICRVACATTNLGSDD